MKQELSAKSKELKSKDNQVCHLPYKKNDRFAQLLYVHEHVNNFKWYYFWLQLKELEKQIKQKDEKYNKTNEKCKEV